MTQEQIKRAEYYWKSVLARQKEELSDMVEDHVDALDSDQPRLDNSKNILKLSTELDATKTLLNNLNCIKNGQ
tara:strand:+ start:3296 stop:3514 length:219 start_codon:yes stop_codon:yes gene_type:complete